MPLGTLSSGTGLEAMVKCVSSMKPCRLSSRIRSSFQVAGPLEYAGDHEAAGPSGVVDQSNARIRSPISPPTARNSRPGSPGTESAMATGLRRTH